MIKLMQAARSVRWTLLSAAIFGLFIGGAFTQLGNQLLEWYDELNPVLTLDAKIVSVDSESIVLEATGEKNRKCQYVRLQSYTVRADGIRDDTQITRIDQAEDKDSKPTGKFYFGVWRIWPNNHAKRVEVWSQHLCGQRMLVQKVVDMKVSP